MSVDQPEQDLQPVDVDLDLRPGPHPNLQINTQLEALQRDLDILQLGLCVSACYVLPCPYLAALATATRYHGH